MSNFNKITGELKILSNFLLLLPLDKVFSRYSNVSPCILIFTNNNIKSILIVVNRLNNLERMIKSRLISLITNSHKSIHQILNLFLNRINFRPLDPNIKICKPQ